MMAQLARAGEGALNHPASSSLFIETISLKPALPIAPAYLKLGRVSTHRASPSLTSPHHCAYSLITERGASILASSALIQLEILSTCMNISNGETLPSLI